MVAFNKIGGYSPATYYFLPMLNIPFRQIPGFRDCLVKKNKILVFVKDLSLSNDQILVSSPLFIDKYTYDKDTAYLIYEFIAPTKWSKDFDRMITKQFSSVSDEYVRHVQEYFPRLSKQGIVNKMFGRDFND